MLGLSSTCPAVFCTHWVRISSQVFVFEKIRTNFEKGNLVRHLHHRDHFGFRIPALCQIDAKCYEFLLAVTHSTIPLPIIIGLPSR